MPSIEIRKATIADNDALIALERACPQGANLSIASERKDYFVRAKFYGNQHTIVATAGGVVVAVLAGTLKPLEVDGREVTGALLYDFRLHPDYRRALGGVFVVRAWNQMEAWARESGADFIYGFVKTDNHIMRGFFDRKGYSDAGRMVIASRAVFRRKAVRFAAAETPRPGGDYTKEFLGTYGDRPLFPVPFRDAPISKSMSDTGLFSYFRVEDGGSSASAGLLRVSEALAMRVLKIPAYYRVARSVARALSPLVKLPSIPRPGETITYHIPFLPTLTGPRGPELWKDLLARFNNRALDAGCTLLTCAYADGDPILSAYGRGAINRIEYILGYKPLTTGLPTQLDGFFVDPRDMD
jgi:hypothetical protein